MTKHHRLTRTQAHFPQKCRTGCALPIPGCCSHPWCPDNAPTTVFPSRQPQLEGGRLHGAPVAPSLHSITTTSSLLFSSPPFAYPLPLLQDLPVTCTLHPQPCSSSGAFPMVLTPNSAALQPLQLLPSPSPALVLRRQKPRGAWVAQSVEHPTVDLGSGHDLTACGFEPHIRLCVDSMEPAWDSLSFLSLPLHCSRSLSKQINFKNIFEKTCWGAVSGGGGGLH